MTDDTLIEHLQSAIELVKSRSEERLKFYAEIQKLRTDFAVCDSEKKCAMARIADLEKQLAEQKPESEKWIPKKGQVVMVRENDDGHWWAVKFDTMIDGLFRSVGGTRWRFCRPLTAEEKG